MYQRERERPSSSKFFTIASYVFLQLCGVLLQWRSIASGWPVRQSVSQSVRKGLGASKWVSKQASSQGFRNRCFYATADVNTDPFSRRISRSLGCRIPYKQALERLGRQRGLSIGLSKDNDFGVDRWAPAACIALLLPVSGTLITRGSSPSSSPWVFIAREREKEYIHLSVVLQLIYIYSLLRSQRSNHWTFQSVYTTLTTLSLDDAAASGTLTGHSPTVVRC